MNSDLQFDQFEAQAYHREMTLRSFKCLLVFVLLAITGMAEDSVAENRRLAELGIAKAQCTLGCVYYHGEGVPKDYPEAAKWYRLAVERGNAYAQSRLGVMLEYGLGVPKDYAEAAKWYRMAAEQGIAIAQHNLGLMYVKGEGVPKNLVQAHARFNVAGANGVDVARRNLSILEEDMTAEQKTEAMKLAREIFANLPKK